MTEKQLRDTVERWRLRLAPEWRITDVRVGFPDDCEDTGQKASSWMSDDYHTARIAFAPKTPALPDDDVERTVIHEILHFLFRDLGEAARRPLYALASDIGVLTRNALSHEEEQLIDRLAFSLLETTRDEATGA